MTALLLPWLALVAAGLDLTRQALTATGEITPDPATEAALAAHRRTTDRLPVTDALELIHALIADRRSREWAP